MAKISHLIRSTRPTPPASLAVADDFAPDNEGLGAWVQKMFIDEDGPLCNPRHEHLRNATIGWLWTTAESSNRDRMTAGQCQLVAPPQRKWGSAMRQWQIVNWFGTVPDFIITIFAPFAEVADDFAFCALIEHELCHAAQDVDPFGEPRFSNEGKPLFRLISHDVEEFNDVVARYGARAAGVETMVRLANIGPILGQAEMTMACGSCSGRMAA